MENWPKPERDVSPALDRLRILPTRTVVKSPYSDQSSDYNNS